jgi:3-phenylpropionate/cinnamic acid dioxygenase small subunit
VYDDHDPHYQEQDLSVSQMWDTQIHSPAEHLYQQDRPGLGDRFSALGGEMKITEYDKARNVHTINIIFGVGVRDREVKAVVKALEDLSYKSAGSQTVDCTDSTKASMFNYTLDEQK